jgi:hypothetical protein
VLIRGIRPSRGNGLSSLVLTPCRTGKLVVVVVVVVVSNCAADRQMVTTAVTVLSLSTFDLFSVFGSEFALNVGHKEPFILFTRLIV